MKQIHIIATRHLDVAWLWTRTPQGEDLMRQCFERAIELIEADPHGTFVFSRSTAWSFWIVQQRYPALFEQIRRYVADGRIELCGGERVEPDNNDCRLAREGALLTVVKQAEDGNGMVLRLFEYRGQERDASLTFCREVESACECDMLERPAGTGACAVEPSAPVNVDGTRMAVALRPFEIKTLRVALRGRRNE